MITVVCGDEAKAISIRICTAKILGQIFGLNAASLFLQQDENVIRPNQKGVFEGLDDNGVYEVFGQRRELENCETQLPAHANFAEAQLTQTGPAEKKAITLLMPEREIKGIVAEVQDECSSLVGRTSVFSSAPQVALVMQSMFLVSACSMDVSLFNENSQKFEYMRNPKSLQACLCQIAASICAAMKLANEKMTDIRNALRTMPEDFETAREVLLEVANGNAEDAEETLEEIKGNILDATGICKKAANDVKNKFDYVIKETDEVNQAVAATKGFEEEQERKTAEQREQEEEKLKSARERKELIEKEIAEQEEIRKKVMAQYEEQLKNSSNLGSLFTMALTDAMTGLVNSVGNVISLKFLKNLTLSNTFGPASSKSVESDALSRASMAAFEKTLEGVIETLEDEEAGKDDVDDVIRSLTLALDFSKTADDKISNALKKQVKGVLSTLRKLYSEESLNAAETQVNKKMQSLAKTLSSALECYQMARISAEEERKAREESKWKRREAEQGREKNLEVQKEKTKRTLLEAAQHGLNTAAQRLKTENERADILHKEQSEVEKRLLETIVTLKSLEMKNITLGNVIVYLKSASDVLAEMKKHWSELASFFDILASLVDITLAKNVNNFLQNAFVNERDGNVVGYKSLKKTSQIRRNFPKVSRAALKSIAFAMQLVDVSDLYLTISSKYVIPEIAGASRYLSVSADEAEIKKREITEASAKAQEEVMAMIAGYMKEQKSKILRILDEKQRLAIQNE